MEFLVATSAKLFHERAPETALFLLQKGENLMLFVRVTAEGNDLPQFYSYEDEAYIRRYLDDQYGTDKYTFNPMTDEEASAEYENNQTVFLCIRVRPDAKIQPSVLTEVEE